jgi:hypothetical protein
MTSDLTRLITSHARGGFPTHIYVHSKAATKIYLDDSETNALDSEPGEPK